MAGGWETVYGVCLIAGLVYALATLFWGDVIADMLGEIHLPLLQPAVLASGLTAFGGIGFLLTRLTALSSWTVFAASLFAGGVLAAGAHFLWIRPMERAEVSIGYSMSQLEGKIGEVGTSIPANGLGEVLIPMVSGITHHMAASLENEPIPAGTRVVVVEVRDHVLYVTPFPE